MTIELNIKAKPKPIAVEGNDAFLEAPFVKSILKNPNFSYIEKMEFIGWVRVEWRKRDAFDKCLLMQAKNVNFAFTWDETAPSEDYWSNIYFRSKE